MREVAGCSMEDRLDFKKDPLVILINKPKGETSFKVVNKLKHSLGCRKIGHAGTLDPMAEGLLVCAINKATRLIRFLQDGFKSYRGTFRIGISTDTCDIEGNTIYKSNTSNIQREQVVALSSEFLGELEQIPPKVSAVRIGGKRSYQLFREGKEVKLCPRRVHIAKFSIWHIGGDDYGFSIKCSTGTYVRSVVRDIGVKLGVGAMLTSLIRTESEPFVLEHASMPDNLSRSSVLTLDEVFSDYKFVVPAHIGRSILMGSTEPLFNTDIKARLSQSRKRLVAIASPISEHRIHSVVFVNQNDRVDIINIDKPH